MSYVISRIRIRDFRGIQNYDHKVEPKGAIIRGGNHRGKTSIVKAIWAALEGQDIRGDAVRIGADESEILIDLNDSVLVKRRIQREGGSSIAVTTRDGAKYGKADAWLSKMVGSVLDPLDFYLKKDRERLALVLDAMPAKLTRDEALARIDPTLHTLVPDPLPEHGIEACSAISQAIYDARTEVNRDAKTIRSTDEGDRASIAELRSKLPPEFTAEMIPSDAVRSAASARVAELHTKIGAASESVERMRKHREELSALEAEEQSLTAAARCWTPAKADDLLAAQEDRRANANAVEAAELALRAAKERFETAETRRANLDFERSTAAEHGAKAATIRERIANVERVAADLVVAPPSEEELKSAIEDHNSIDELAKHGATFAAIGALESRLKATDERAKATEERSKKMSDAIDAFRTTIPSELLEKSNGIPGLKVQGLAIYLDGKNLDGLSGQEQMSFAVDLAKRLNRGSKILVVDGLERIDGDEIDAFYKLATADGWQLIGTRVERGELVTEAVEVAP